MPRRHEHILLQAPFGAGRFFLKFPKNKILMRKDRCAELGCNNDRLFPEKFKVKANVSSTKQV